MNTIRITSFLGAFLLLSAVEAANKNVPHPAGEPFSSKNVQFSVSQGYPDGGNGGATVDGEYVDIGDQVIVDKISALHAQLEDFAKEHNGCIFGNLPLVGNQNHNEFSSSGTWVMVTRQGAVMPKPYQIKQFYFGNASRIARVLALPSDWQSRCK